MQFITSWDDTDTETPDYPTEIETVQEQYPGIDAGDYASWDDLSSALWKAHGEGMTEMYRSMGVFIVPDPVDAASQAIDRAATVLWNARTQE